MDEKKPYHIDKRGDTVVLKTTSFRTERRSVLHSGIYNRELASSLAAGAVVLAGNFFFALSYRITAVFLAAAVLLFAVSFVLFRVYVFREAVLETVFDAPKGAVTVSLKRAFASPPLSYPFGALKAVRLEHSSMQPENVDAVQLVERVALQHGTVIPGFGKTEEFYSVVLDFGGQKRVIFSAGRREAAVAVVDELKSAVGGRLPDEVWAA
jgi:hypothetical protein